MALIPRAEATMHAEMSIPLHPYRLTPNTTTQAASKATTIITDVLGLRSLQGIGKSWVLAHLKIYGGYDRLLECLQVRYTDAMDHGDSDDNGDQEQRVEATIDATESR